MSLGSIILFIGAVVLMFDRHPILGALCLLVVIF